MIEKRPKLANRRGVIFHDNAKPHVALAIRKKLLQFDWDVLSQFLYFPDFILSDYYLFLLLKKFFSNKLFQSVSEIKTHLEEYFANKPNFGKRK